MAGSILILRSVILVVISDIHSEGRADGALVGSTGTGSRVASPFADSHVLSCLTVS